MSWDTVTLSIPLHSAMLPSDDRPLADDADKIRKLYAVRYPIYTSSADVVIRAEGSPEQTAEKLLEKLK